LFLIFSIGSSKYFYFNWLAVGKVVNRKDFYWDTVYIEYIGWRSYAQNGCG